MALVEAICPVLIGREAERDRLAEMIARAAAGRGGVAIVAGEAGMGKTRLLEEVCRESRANGVTTLVGACVEEERRIAYLPLIDALRGHVRGLADDLLRELIAGLEPDLVKLLPELTARVPGLQPSAPLSAAEERSRLFEVMLQAFTRIAGDGTLLLILEDLHWADEGSVAAVRYLARHLRDTPMLLVVTYRPGEAEPDHPLADVVADLVHRRLAYPPLVLPSLSPHETGLMTAALLPGRPPAAALVDLLHARTEGNPLFTEEIMRALRERGRPAADGGAADLDALAELPASLAHMLRRRIARLSRTARAVLVAAAVIGRRFDGSLLAGVADLPDEAVDEALHEALEHQVIVERGDAGADLYEFRHVLIQEAALGLLLSSERRGLHRRVAQRLEAAGEGDAGRHVSALAYHYGRAGDRERVRPLAEQAGDQVWRAGSPQEAARWFEQSLEAGRALGEGESVALLEKAARASFEAGGFEAAASFLERAAAHYVAAEDVERAGEAQTRRARALWYAGGTTAALELLDVTRAALEPLGETGALARALAGLANVHLTAFRGREAYELARRGLDLARRTGAGDAEAQALKVIGTALAAGPDPERGRVILRQAFERAAAAGVPQEASISLLNLTLACMKAADWAAAEATAREGIAFCRRWGLLDGQGALTGMLAEVCRLTGRWDEAETFATEAPRLLGSGSGVNWAGAHLRLCALQVDQGRWDEVRDGIATVMPTAERSGEFQSLGIALLIRAHAALAAGDSAAALADTERSLTLWRSTADSFWGLPLLLFAVRLYCALGRLDDARTCHDDIRAVVGRAPTATAAVTLTAAGATIAVAEARWDEAMRGWEEAAAGWSALGRPLDHARALVEHGRALLRRGMDGDRDAARRALLAARAIVEGLGAPEAASIDDLLRRARLVAPPSRRARNDLSDREREVTALVAQGQTNRQIAEALFLSEKTVENHIGRILAKLALNSRAQLAAHAARHGLLDGHRPFDA